MIVRDISRLHLLTNTVVAQSLDRSSDILSICSTRLLRLGTSTEASRVSPSTNSHANLGALVEKGTDLVQWHEWLILLAISEQGRSGKSCGDVGDTRSHGAIGQVLRVPSGNLLIREQSRDYHQGSNTY